MDPMTEAKLWENPCGFAFRVNYLALRYNTPCYATVHDREGLSRIEYVVIYSLALHPGGRACDIAASSGFPKNSLSRAITKLERLNLVRRRRDTDDARERSLHLTRKGRALFERTLPGFEHRERQMLGALSAAERRTLSTLLARVVEHVLSLPDEVQGSASHRPRTRGAA